MAEAYDKLRNISKCNPCNKTAKFRWCVLSHSQGEWFRENQVHLIIIMKKLRSFF